MPDKDKWIILYGNVPPTTTSISIGDYTLQEYKPGNTEFAYKISEVNGTIKEGENRYTLKLNSGSENPIQETLTYYFSDNTGALEEYRTQVNSGYLARINTPALIAERQRKKDEKKSKLISLDDRYYYNSEWEIFKLKVAYTTGPQGTELYAQEIEKILKNLGVMTELVAYKTSDVEDLIRSWKKDYDMLIIGIETPGNIWHIGQLFLSSEAWVGVNFSNIESPKLDELFISLRTATDVENVRKITADITNFMQEESFFLPISSPQRKIYIDRNLKWVHPISVAPDISEFYSMFNYVSIKDTYIMNMTGKSVLQFFTWILDQAF